MSIILIFLFTFFLAIQVLPSSLGVRRESNSLKTFTLVIIPVAAQMLFFWFGYLLGSKFIYLMQDIKTAVVFAGFFIIGIRFIVDAFVVRKGKRTFQTVNGSQYLLASVAQSTNTFLIGLLFSFFAFQHVNTLAFLGLLTLIVSLSGMLSKVSKNSLALASLLILLGGVFMLVSSFYLAFF